MAKPNALPFIVIPLTSVFFGIFLNYMMFHKGPGQQMPSLVKLSAKQLIKNLGVELDFSLASKVGLVAKSGLQHSIPTKVVQLLGSGEPSKILWLLISFFKVALDRSLGQSIVLLILGITAPLLLKASLETIKPKKSSSALLGALTVLFFTSIGQIITIACATNFFYVPLYSLARYNQIKSADQKSIHASSFDSSSLILVLGLNSLAGVIFFFTTFVPIHSEYWVLTNIIFQFFPLVLIPLLFTPRAKPMQTSRSNGFLTASSLFKQISFFAVMIHYLAIFLALPQVIEASKASKSYSVLTIAKTLFGGLNDGEWLLLFDTLGMLGASILILSLDRFAEEQKGEKRNKEVSPRLSLVLLLGPGFVLADFMARKQEAVEGKILKKE